MEFEGQTAANRDAPIIGR